MKNKDLKSICPNCHTQTETWDIKNISKEGRKRLLEAGQQGKKFLRGYKRIATSLTLSR